MFRCHDTSARKPDHNLNYAVVSVDSSAGFGVVPILPGSGETVQCYPTD